MVHVKLCSMCQQSSQSRTGHTTCAHLMQTQNRPPIARWALLLQFLCPCHSLVQAMLSSMTGAAVPAAALDATLLCTAAGHSQAPHAPCW